MDLAPQTIIAGRFRLESLLGRGGMGSVWRATHLGLDIACAVKFIDEQHASSPELRMRFEREAKAAAQLRSPHVVQILDHGVFQGTPYIAMELLEGEDLRARLKVRGRLAPKDVAGVIDQIARALARAHAAGIVHRDLKPENVFLVHDEDREIAKVLDFGIAKAQDPVGGVSSHTRTGALLGTPYYMSPEQAQGNKAVDWRSDLWSLAVITYECMTGRKPFESDGLGDLLMQIISAPLPPPSRVAPVPGGFDAWWARAAERAPERRFQSAKELADALRAVVEAPGAVSSPGVASPFAMTPQPGAPYGMTPQPSAPYGMTPQPGAPYAHTPQPGRGGAFSTASQIARTLGTTGPAKTGGRAAIFGGVAAAAVCVLGITAFGAWHFLHRSSSTSAAAAPPPAAVELPAPAVATTTTTPVVADPQPAAPTPPAAPASAPSPEVDAKPAPQAPKPGAVPGPGPLPAPHPAAPTTPHPAAPAAPADRTGF